MKHLRMLSMLVCGLSMFTIPAVLGAFVASLVLVAFEVMLNDSVLVSIVVVLNLVFAFGWMRSRGLLDLEFYETGKGSVWLLLGHVGPLFSVFMVTNMVKAGYGSGLVLLPAVIWSVIFYGVGLARTFKT